MLNVFSVDVEDYFQVEAFSKVVRPEEWGSFPSRVEGNTERILEMLDSRQVRGTFFVLGWVAKRYPSLIRTIAAQGHEIASHGMSHQLVYNQSPESFKSEAIESKALLEDQCQQCVRGYRAATYSITTKSLWALDILCDAGYSYDSSIFPVWHDKYGIPNAPQLPHRMLTPLGREIIEFPITVLDRVGIRIPIAGGGYFRLFPYSFTHWALAHVNSKAQAFVFYIHPWEIDIGQPKILNAALLSRIRHYLNIGRCSGRLERLLTDFKFSTMHESLIGQGLLSDHA